MDDSNIVIQPQEAEGSVTINIPLDGTTAVTSDNLQVPEAPQQNQEETSASSTVAEPIDTQPNTEAPDTNGVQSKGIEPEIKPKHPGGRPCEYCEDKEHILKITEEYVNGKKSLDKPKMPFIGELAIILDRDDETITLWAEKKKDNELEHPEFSALIKKLKSIQHLRLQQRLLGRYNPTGSIMWLKTKFGYIETEKQVLAGDKNEPLEITITEDRPKVQNE